MAGDMPAYMRARRRFDFAFEEADADMLLVDPVEEADADMLIVDPQLSSTNVWGGRSQTQTKQNLH